MARPLYKYYFYARFEGNLKCIAVLPNGGSYEIQKFETFLYHDKMWKDDILIVYKNQKKMVKQEYPKTVYEIAAEEVKNLVRKHKIKLLEKNA
jgi:hypothetical protein